jgi:phosphate transport system protein
MTREAFYHELDLLRERMVSMGSMVDKAVARAMDSLTHQDVVLARRIIQNDAAINEYRWATEDEAFQVIATQAPLAGDLRLVLAAISIATDLERMADHAVGIAKVVIDTADEPPLKRLDLLQEMADISRRMLSDSMTAFIQGDIDAAMEIIQRDDVLDSLYKRFGAEMIDSMLANPTVIDRATRLIWVGHNLERIGDRVTNICERVIYGVTGKVDLEPIRR